MKKVTVVLLVLFLFSCMDADFDNEDLCTYVSCGEPVDDQVNLAVFNNTSIDFESLVWSIGGQVDTVFVLSFDQFSCWRNYDSLNTSYIYAEGLSLEQEFTSDTLFIDEAIVDTVNTGSYRLTISRNLSSEELFFSLEAGYDGGCVAF
jgi:hypothetical protein